MEKRGLDFIRQQQREIILLGQANALLDWDQQTYMPEQGVNSRSEQAGLLSRLMHERMTSNQLFRTVKGLRGEKLREVDRIMIERLYKQLLKSRKIPHEYVEELSRVTTLAGVAWRRARKEKSFRVFQPHLSKIIKLKRREADFIGLKGMRYNSLLDDFEEGMTAEKLRPVFEKLKYDLVELLRKIEGSRIYRNQKYKMLNSSFDDKLQRELVDDVAARMGLKKEISRIDLSEHPFTTKVGANDVRFTTAFRKDPMFAFGSSVHEAGHALYEVNMPSELAYTVIGDAPSLGLHESQSRFWENMIGKSENFWKFYYPKFAKSFGLRGDFEQFYREVNMVNPGKIRVESDEVHYCLHVILRFELELDLLEGKLEVRDVPKEWNRKMKELFGVRILNDVEGCMQDVHWSMGAVGYFPTYAIGTMYAAQLYEAMKKQYPTIEGDIARGDFSKIAAWLHKKIHRHGSKFLAEDVMRKATGKGLDPSVYVNYLNQKYAKIYGF